ncbi:hypothetical protein [Turneriella parva]|uniref:Uncharacterized protein n=1 Tax=Turneriella parva (strain ATCC BAA-1111 / DSM 21527 / NCTC 11395 / H) TaxID=869212 RepID=I4B559_TURPD|nr:hypothetical protein [Turneriella parva]AFM12416.1 hypothetical protein Turpa_1769 [Turneriella parva DSM 21527]
MKIHITIEPGKYTGRTILWLKNHRKTTTFFLALIGAVAIWAAPITKPFTFTNGGVVSATEMNQNFDALYTGMSQRLGSYCGASTATNGNIGSYAAAKTLCQTACSDTNAHMCTVHEILIELQSGTDLGTTKWISVGFNGATYFDCNRWTTSTAGPVGPAVLNTGFVSNACSSSIPVACCR